MPRRTVYLPESTDRVIRRVAKEERSYSAALVRLVEEGARALKAKESPSYVGAGEGPTDLGRLAEEYLRQLVEAR